MSLVEEQKKTITKLEEGLADKNSLYELERQKNDINEKMQAVLAREKEAILLTNEKLKEVADRAIKLAEVSKPTSNWQLQGLAYIAVAVGSYLLGRR